MPRAIWALGFVSLLMDISSERVHISGVALIQAGTLAGLLWQQSGAPAMQSRP